MKLKKTYFLILLIIFLMLDEGDIFSQMLNDFKVKKIKVDGRELKVAVADTLEKREKGLSYTDASTLKKKFIDGMLFIFNDDKEKVFQAWYMKYDLMLLVLEQVGDNNFTVISRKPLRIGTTVRVKGKWILEIPLEKD